MKQIRDIVKSQLAKSGGLVTLGESASYNWIHDPARLLFSLARYKFVSKMLAGKKQVLEIGAADSLASYIVAKTVTHLTCVDIDPELTESAAMSVKKYSNNMSFISGDILDKTFLNNVQFDGSYMLDVLEHIDPDKEHDFINNICRRLEPFATLIIGLPSLESQKYASALSKIGHINCKTHKDLLSLCEKHFFNTFMFGANDEVVNTGFPELQHYRIAVCVSPRIHHVANKANFED